MPSEFPGNTPHRSLTTVEWLVCAMAAIGFAFDIYELLMLPIILKPALAELGGRAADGSLVLAPGSAAYVSWARWLFFAPAVVGGIFGLLGGYLTDLLGRRRVLTWSILLYALSAFASGFVTNPWQLLALRCLVFAGVCVEFVAAVAWLAELFDDPKRREKVLGYTQAFSSFGGLMVGVVFWLIARNAASLPEIRGGHEAWRYMLISGIIPALPLILIRPFLPESPKWQQRRAAGTLRRPSLGELFGPGLVRTTVVTTLCYAASYGMAFGAIQQLAQILPAHAKVREETAAALERTLAASDTPVPEPKRKAIEGRVRDETVANVQIWQEVGGLAGRLALALLAVQIVSRRKLLWVFQVPALLFVPLLFWWIGRSLDDPASLWAVKAGIFLAGFLVVSQFSFWGNYIPRVFPLHLRGTGESFAANIGGRIIGTAAAALTLTFSTADGLKPVEAAARLATTGAIVAGLYCLGGLLLSVMLTEPGEAAMYD